MSGTLVGAVKLKCIKPILGLQERKSDRMTSTVRTIGLMSGTSIDGIDAALIETDGNACVQPLAFLTFPYPPPFRDAIRRCFGRLPTGEDRELAELERALTDRHADAVQSLLASCGLAPSAIALIGFHGQTLTHRPADGLTVQIGDGARLAQRTGIPVVNDFRTADVQAGGQGAPLVPLYHRALAASLPKPVVVANIGGVANITWIGGDGDDQLIACDTGPGNALIDDWLLQATGLPYDDKGETAARGKPDPAYVDRFLRHPYFQTPAPKALDRDAFAGFTPHGMSVDDGAATLTMMTVCALAAGIATMPTRPRTIYVTGGGRHNATLLLWLEQATNVKVVTVDALGWNGDALEAEAFAYLAQRSLLGLPLTLPLTTGVARPTTGGVIHRVETRRD
jgi:anhydro-N-acetylmuramic acid kinase